MTDDFTKQYAVMALAAAILAVNVVMYGTLYFIAAKISAETMDKLNETVTLVRNLDKIRTKLTLIQIKEKK